MVDCKTFMRACAAFVGAAVVTAAAALDPQQFVAGWPIAAPDGAEVFDVPLTAEIYAAAAEGVERLAVLDANGVPQPFYRRTPPAAPPAEPRIVLDASPLYAGVAAALPRVGVATSGGGTSVTVTPGAEASAEVTGFVLDARTVATAPVALELEWPALPQPFLLEVVVEQSADLTSWRTVGRAAVASLTIGDQEVRHARVPVRAAAGGYFRITSSGRVADWEVTRATLVGAATAPVPPLSLRLASLSADAVPEDGPDDALYFDAGGLVPASSVSLAFPGNDGWLRADVAASHSLDGPWMPVAYRELFYALTFEGRELASTPLAVGRREVRFWRLVPAAPPRERSPELVLGFPQEQLRVAVAGGLPPYQLAAGTLAEEAGPDATLAAVWASLSSPQDSVPLAALGARQELGGAAALVAKRVFPWRVAALWAVLIVGVLVVGTMAVRLARELGRPPS